MRALLSSLILTAGIAMAAPAMAQDSSPTLLIETGPNSNPQYRRVVFIKYLAGNSVQMNYRADNRTEFQRVDTQTPQALIDSCASGQATRLSEIIAFSRDEAKRARQGREPETRSFCIKNVRNWERRNRDTYLDPIFQGLPVSVQGL
jgi:hypothetical protein